MANAQLDIQFVTNRLGNQSIIYNGYQFRVKTRRDERVYWICTTRNCPATLNTRNNITTKLPNGHNHDNHKVKLQVDEILQTIKKRCRNGAERRLHQFQLYMNKRSLNYATQNGMTKHKK